MLIATYFPSSSTFLGSIATKQKGKKYITSLHSRIFTDKQENKYLNTTCDQSQLMTYSSVFSESDRPMF